MAGQLLLIVVAAVVASINALPQFSLAPYQTYPSLAPYHFGGPLPHAVKGNFTVQPRDTVMIKSRPLRNKGPGFTIQPREPGFTIQPREPGFTVQPRDTAVIKSRPLRNQEPGYTIQPREPGFTIQPRDTAAIKTRPLRFRNAADYTLECEKKKQVAKVNPGESVQFSSPNYPANYGKKSKCNWQIKGKTSTTRISISCDAFKLQNANKKNGKCSDALIIDGTKYCGTDYPVYNSEKNVVNMSFKSNKKKHFPGFTCTATAYDDSITTTVEPTTTEMTTEEPTVAPTTPPTGTCSCGRVNQVSRIVGGVETDVNEYPWMVALAWSEYSSSAFCGGSIINERWILTAAHCADVMSLSNVVVAGEHTWSTDSETSATQKIAIEQILMNPNYNDNTYDIDVALIKLSTPLTFDSNNNVAPVCPPDATNLYENVDAIVTGWGTLSSGGDQPDSLMEVVVPTMSNSACESAYGSSSITDNMLCAGLDAGGKDSCQGDSGGPMVTADGSIYRQIGVVSWGYGCAYAGYPGVYARVTSQLEWITASISGTSWCDAGTVVTSGPVNTTPEPTVTTAAPSTDCSCGRVNRASRIVGGVSTEVNEYPWMAALAWSSSYSSAFCGASIISENYVLTAAHCAAVMDGSEVVVVGEHTWSTSGESTVRETVAIAQIISHPNYNPSTMENDIALLKLSTSLTFGSDNKVAPICPPEADNLYSGIDAVATGWGTTASGGSLSDTLLEVTVPTMDNSLCQSNYAVYGSDDITSDMICAGLPEGGKDSCQGDSGGPLSTQDSSSLYRQIGVVSWGYGCAYPGLPGVYARVTSQLSWLSSEMSDSGWCSSGATPAPTAAPVTPAPTDAPSGTCSCGRVNRSTRIVGGVETQVNEYPWMVALSWSASSSSAFCGASIINENWILTAAHCADVMSTSNVVVVGEHSWSSSSETDATQKYAIEQIVMNPNYNDNTMDHDVALIKLSTPLTFDANNNVAPVCPPAATNLYSNVDALVTGWGTLASGGSQPDTLMEVVVPTMSNSACESAYGSSITDNMLCAGLDAGGKDSCQGDSGGPMVTADGSFYRQIGVVSWGYGCAYAGYPGVYARVTSELEWITSTISGTSWCDAGTVGVTPPPTAAPVTPAPTDTPTGTCSCGRVNRASRIVGGVETEVNEYPWMVALAWSASSSSAFCGASIINERWILTASHCADVMSTSNVVVVGEHSWSSSSESDATQKYAIEQILMNPNYDSGTLMNDVALLKLATPLTFDANNNVAPVCPPDATNLYENVDAIVSGWGTLSSGGSQPDSLQEVVVPTMTNSACESGYGSSITDDMLCAGYEAGGKDSCQGDSGGPLVTADGSIYRQIGVVSWGYGCASAGYPGVYARVTSQLEWIAASISGTSWCDAGTSVTSGPVVTEAPTGDCKCGRVNRNTRIINGQETEVLEYPWQAGLVGYGGSRTFCGGSLVNSKWVLTAAHCTDGTEPSSIQVLLGEHTIYETDATEQRFSVSTVINHPSYITNPWNNGHDVSLLELSSEVDFSSTQIRPICLPSTTDLFAGADATVTGWGTIAIDAGQSLVLMEVDIPVVTNTVCGNMYGPSSIDDTMICAGEGAGNGACMGDSGGPLITSLGDYHVQIGVVSFGSSNCDALGVYARVTALKSWIEGYTNSGNAEVCSP